MEVVHEIKCRHWPVGCPFKSYSPEQVKIHEQKCKDRDQYETEKNDITQRLNNFVYRVTNNGLDATIKAIMLHDLNEKEKEQRLKFAQVAREAEKNPTNIRMFRT
jgi:hypothetical protein